MIYKVESLVTADAILNAIQNSTEMRHVDALVDAYQNGREQGYVIWPQENSLKNVAYYICEQRRSDSICIYKGKYEMQSISDDAYNHPNTFGRDFDAAIDWLKTELKQYIKETA